ncbi:MAG: TonB-dependent receptor [Bacteroidota bacterium]
MTKTCLFVVCVCLLFPLSAFPQGEDADSLPGRIQGKVVNASTQTPLELVSITVFRQADNSLLTGELSGKDGDFSISLPYGRYMVEANFIGLEEQRIDSIKVDEAHPQLDLGDIQLEFPTEYLEEVTISGDRNLVEIALDKRIYRVGKDVASAGGSVLEVLDNVPSVSAEPGGAVSLRGNRGVQILIDGKPSALVSKGNTSGLQALSADLIAQIEVITNPSAKYEADGTAGIINIVLKKEKQAGLSGAANLTSGHPSLFNSSFNLNWKREKFSLFADASFRNDIVYGIGSARQVARLGEDSTDIFLSNSIYNTGGPSATVRIGGDWQITKSLSLTSSLFALEGREEVFSEITYENFLNSLLTYQGGSSRIENRNTERQKREWSATLTKTFPNSKQELKADFRLQNNADDSQSDFQESFLERDGQIGSQEDLLQRSAFQLAERRLIAKLDYTLPMGEKQQLEIGGQSSLRAITNGYVFEELVENDWVVAEDFTNAFAYDEAIHAAYGLYKNSLDAFSFQLGLRSEYAIISTSSAPTSPRHSLNFFPSAHLSYQLPKANKLQASYTRRIQRPRSMSLNPFIALDDNRAFFSGNPNLIPEITDTYELGHVKKWKKGSIGSFLFYRHTVNVIEVIVREAENKEGIPIFFRQPENLRSKDDVGLEFNLAYQPAKFWSLNSDLFLYRAAIDGTNISEAIVAETYTGFGRITSNLTLFDKLKLQLRLNYSAPRNIAQGRRKAMTSLNLGLSKSFLKDRGKLSLNVADLFQSRYVRIDFHTDQLSRENDYRWSRRTIRLTLSYRFRG